MHSNGGGRSFVLSSTFSLESFICFDLWFVPAILILYLLFPIIYKFIEHYGYRTFWISIMCCFFAIFIPIHSQVYELGIPRLPTFLLGILASSRQIALKVNIFNIIISVLVIALSYLHFVLGMNFYSYLFVLQLSYILLSIALPLLLFITLKLSQLIKSIWEFFGSITLELYLCHEFIFKEISKSNLNVYLLLLIGIGSSVIIALFTHKFNELIIRKNNKGLNIQL